MEDNVSGLLKKFLNESEKINNKQKDDAKNRIKRRLTPSQLAAIKKAKSEK